MRLSDLTSTFGVTMIPNQVLDAVMDVHSGVQFKTALLISHWAFRDPEKRLGMDEIIERTGASRKSCYVAVAALRDLGWLSTEKVDGTTVYSLSPEKLLEIMGVEDGVKE